MEEILDNTGVGSAERVGFGPRFGAFVLDIVLSIVLGLILAPVGALLGVGAGGAAGGAIGGTEEERAAAAALGGIFGMLLGAMVMIYVAVVLYGLIEAFTGASPGKMILGLKIGNQDGSAANINTYVLRWAVKNSGNLIQAIAGFVGIQILTTVGSLAGLAILVGCFFVLGANRQAFQDMAAKTAVFKKGDIHNG